MRVTFLLVIIAAAVFASLVHREKGNPPPRAEKSMEAEDAPEPQLARADAAVGIRRLPGTVELDREPDGHFYADVDVNGATLHMLVDTGASAIALSREDARSAGIATSIGMPDVIGRGADGDVHGEVATLDRVSLGEKTAEGLPAVILNSGEQSLLGQSFLSKFDRVEIEGDKMLLQ
jgi:aspartyl protease family protein